MAAVKDGHRCAIFSLEQSQCFDCAGLVRCAECDRNYHRSDYDRCFECR